LVVFFSIENGEFENVVKTRTGISFCAILQKKQISAVVFHVSFRALKLLVGQQEDDPAHMKVSDEVLVWLSV